MVRLGLNHSTEQILKVQAIRLRFAHRLKLRRAIYKQCADTRNGKCKQTAYSTEH